MVRVIRPQDLAYVDAPPPQAQERLSNDSDLTVRIAGLTMRMRFDDPSISRRFAVRYGAHLADGPPDLTFNYARDEAGAHYFWSDASAWSWPAERLSPEAIVLLIDATAMSALVRSDPGLISFHAAAILLGDCAAAIVGDSTAGKTTTTVACARRGMQVYSDERLLVRGDGRVLPFLRAFNIRGGGASLLHEDGLVDSLGAALAARSHTQDWTDLSPFEVMPQPRVPAPRPLRALFLLEGKGETPVLEPLRSPLACPRMLSSVDCTSLLRMDRAAAIMSLLRDVQVFRMTLGRPDASARAIEHVLERMRCDAA